MAQIRNQDLLICQASIQNWQLEVGIKLNPAMRTTSRRGTVAGWAAIAVLFAATTCVESMSWTQLTAYTPLYLRQLHGPASHVPSWIAAMSSLGWILAMPLPSL